MIPARSLVVEAQERTKTLRLGDSAALAALSDKRCEDRARLAAARKAEVIELYKRVAALGLSKRAFVRRWGHKWETGRDYLDEDQPKKRPRARSIRVARAVVNLLEAMATAEAEANARFGAEVSSW